MISAANTLERKAQAKRTMNVELSEEELAARKAAFSWTFPAQKYPRFLRLFVKNVGSMAKGGIWE